MLKRNLNIKLKSREEIDIMREAGRISALALKTAGKAINRIVEMRGGQVVVAPEEMMDIALPIAGLMSPVSGHEVAFRTLCIQEKVREIGCQMKSPFITMAFMCLPVIPDIKITDRHLMDTKTFSAIY